jgi:hypothetical protein
MPPLESDDLTSWGFIRGFGRNQEEFSRRDKIILESYNNVRNITG